MGFKIKNSLTGEFEKLPILTLKGEKGETGGVEEYNKVDYMGNKYETLKQANDANVEYAVKTAIGEFNYLDYDGQHITATDSIEGRSKSAILKGQTLVNIANKNLQNKEKTTTNDSTSTNYALLFSGKGYELAYPLIANKEYLIVEEWNIKSSNDIFHTAQPKIIYEDDTIGYFNSDGNLTTLGVHKLVRKFIPQKNVKDFYFGLTNKAGNTISLALNYAMIIEYQEGMENWDIPYFEGMASVKAPVLKTTGENLIDESNMIIGEGVNSSTGVFTTDPTRKRSDFIRFDSTSIYNVGLDSIFCYDENKNYLGRINPSIGADVLTGTKFVVGRAFKETENIMLSSSQSPYKPYKSNILSTPSDLELRGIGDVQDTLDLMTGEVTERIGEIVLDGSDDLVYNYESNSNDTTTMVHIPIPNTDRHFKFYNDKLANKTVYENTSVDEGIFSDWNGLYIRLLNSKLSSPSSDGVKEYLQSNHITVQYQLATPTIKTVGFTILDQNGQNVKQLMSFNGGTHFTTSSQDGSLLPTLTVDVVTDLEKTMMVCSLEGNTM